MDQAAQAGSKRSAFITFVQAATKSCNELFHGVVLRIDLGVGAQYRVRAEDEIDRVAVHRGRFTGAIDDRVAVAAGRLPRAGHVRQMDEEVVAQHPDAVGEHTVPRAAVVGSEHAQAANEHRHLAGGETQQLRAVEQELFWRHRVVRLLPVAEAVGQRFEYGEGFDVGLRLPLHRRDPARTGPTTATPAALAACSMPTLPASTITSATLAPVSAAIFPWTASTFASRAGSLPSQSFCGASRMRAPLAPPRLSEPRKVRALSQAVATISLTEAGSSDPRLHRATS